MKQFIFLLLVPILFFSCYSYRISASKLRGSALNTDVEKEYVYVVNPEMKEEYSILQSSNIFHIVSDSLDPHTSKIKLLPPVPQIHCANYLMAWGMFLGQIPLSISSDRKFRYAEISDGNETIKEFELPFYKRLWFWDIFSRRKNYYKVAGQALQISYDEK